MAVLKWNTEEFLVGTFVAFPFWFILGPIAAIPMLLCAVLWMAGGQGWFGTKLWRRIGVPLVLSVAMALKTGFSWGYVVAILAGWGINSIGYGLPATQPPDEGSPLGRFWYKLAKGDEGIATFGCRLTLIGALWGVYLIGALLWR